MRTNSKTNSLLTQILFLMLLAVIMVTSGCSNSNNNSNNNSSTPTAGSNNTANNEAAQAANAQDKVITVAISADAGMDQLDAGAYNGSMNVHAMIYDGLVEYGERAKSCRLLRSPGIFPKMEKYIHSISAKESNSQMVRSLMLKLLNSPSNAGLKIRPIR